MSAKLLEQALAAVVAEPSMVQLVYARLAAAADKSGRCRSSQEELARASGCSVDTVKRAMKALEDAGLIHRQFQHRRNGKRRADLVTVTPDKVAHSPVVTRRQGGSQQLGQQCGQPLGQGGSQHEPIDVITTTKLGAKTVPSQEGGLNQAANDPKPLVVIPGGRAA